MKIILDTKNEECTDNSFNWCDLLKRPASKAITIGVFLMMLNQFSGCCAMLYYTATIFNESGSNLSPNSSAMVVGAITFLGSAVATCLVDRSGRKVIHKHHCASLHNDSKLTVSLFTVFISNFNHFHGARFSCARCVYHASVTTIQCRNI